MAKAPSVTALKASAQDRRFESMVLSGMAPASAATECGIKVPRAMIVFDRICARDIGGLLTRPAEERFAEQHAALVAFWMAQRDAIMRDIEWAMAKRRKADVDDPALDIVAAKWSREVAALRAELARAEERLRALVAMEAPESALLAFENAPPAPVELAPLGKEMDIKGQPGDTPVDTPADGQPTGDIMDVVAAGDVP